VERITRALELAYAERETRHEPNRSEATRSESKITVVAPHGVAAAEPVDFTDTVMFRSPVFELTAEVRERERILPPNAGGPHGGAYKMLRTQVLHRLDQLGANTLAVVSAAPGAGKTLTAINLAIAIAAEAGRTALLVDFDLRNPSIARRIGYEPALGVEECLQQRRPVQEAMFKVAGYERLTVLPARGRLEHSSELLSSSRAGELITEMRTRYANRILIFDMPPVLQADDVLAFTRCLQAGLLVIGEGKTRREDVPRTLELLRDLKFVGTVLNGSREPAASCY
jgi:Mrp family chromosome partitioning ATPase